MAEHGFFIFLCLAAQGLCLCLAAQGFLPEQGLAWLLLCERAAQGLAAPHGAARAAPLMAAASAPEEIRVLARVSNFMVFLLGF